MLIRLGYEIGISCPVETPIVTMLGVHPDRLKDLRSDSGIETSGGIRGKGYFDQFGNRCVRFTAPAGPFTMRYDAVIEDPGTPDMQDPDAGEVPIAQLPDDVLVYLLGSRYCETDHMSQTAWDLFGHVRPGWERVQAICDFVHNRLSFGYGYARSTRTAAQAFDERVGVCRDFAHLAITLCRAMNIPARYVNGYMGDIGVPPDPAPMDFNAWIEVYLGGRWFTFDPRHNIARIGRVVVARGRDATDVPLIHTFGSHRLDTFKVWTEEVTDDRTELRIRHRHTPLTMRYQNPATQSRGQISAVA